MSLDPSDEDAESLRHAMTGNWVPQGEDVEWLRRAACVTQRALEAVPEDYPWSPEELADLGDLLDAVTGLHGTLLAIFEALDRKRKREAQP